MLDKKYAQKIQERIDQKTKPVGSLGVLEEIAHHLALMQSQSVGDAVTKVEINKPTMLVFAGDHGIAEEGVSIAPSEVTQQMVLNFLNGGAAINCFCRTNDIEFKVVDCGILRPLEVSSQALLSQRMGSGTANFARQSAMSLATLEQGLALGGRVASSHIADGCNLLMFGEMGIGNTSSASAIFCALSGCEAEDGVGYGTGISPQQLATKIGLVKEGIARCIDKPVKEVLAEVGGFEIVQMVGAFLEAARQNVPVLVDGFIVSVAAYAAVRIEPECREWMIFAHQSEEPGHQLLLSELDATPILDLGLRLGEGTGAALALPLVRAAAEFYNNMASFESAGVTV